MRWKSQHLMVSLEELQSFTPQAGESFDRSITQRKPDTQSFDEFPTGHIGNIKQHFLAYLQNVTLEGLCGARLAREDFGIPKDSQMVQKMKMGVSAATQPQIRWRQQRDGKQKQTWCRRDILHITLNTTPHSETWWWQHHTVEMLLFTRDREAGQGWKRYGWS